MESFFSRPAGKLLGIVLLVGVAAMIKTSLKPRLKTPPSTSPGTPLVAPPFIVSATPSAQTPPPVAKAASTPLPAEWIPTELLKSGRGKEMSKDQKDMLAKIKSAFISVESAREVLKEMSQCIRRTENIEQLLQLYPQLKTAYPDRNNKRNLQMGCVGLGIQLVLKFPELSNQFNTEVLSHAEPEVQEYANSPDAKKFFKEPPVLE
jgi:hypothetical protein